MISAGLVTCSVDDLLTRMDADGDGAIQFNELALWLDSLAAPPVEVAAAPAAVATTRKLSDQHIDSDLKSPGSVPSPVIDNSVLPAESVSFIPYDDLVKGTSMCADPSKKEIYLDEETFLSLFGCQKSDFANLPKWKQDAKKRDLKLF